MEFQQWKLSTQKFRVWRGGRLFHAEAQLRICQALPLLAEDLGECEQEP
jgi:hypothetical protein